MSRTTAFTVERTRVPRDKNSRRRASGLLRHHNSERSEDNMFQKTGSVTQIEAEIKEEGVKFEKKWFHEM